MQFVDETNLEYGEAERKLWERRIKIGKSLLGYIGPVCEKARAESIAARELSRLTNGRLSSAQVRELTSYLDQVKDLDIRRDFFARTAIDKTFGGIAIRLAKSVIDRFSIKAVTNIGAYYAFVDHALARQYPDVRFVAVDFIDEYERYNAEFALPNLSFVSGYSIELIESGRLHADLVIFSATAAEIMNPELHRYLDLLRQNAKYLILSEPLYNMPDGGVVDPKSVSSTSSIAAYAQPDYLPHLKGPVAHIHNYWKLLQESGFKILHYRAYKPDFADIRWIEIVATVNDH
jgi:hypothetical protein